MAQLAAGDVPRLKLKWAFAFPGDARAFAQPAVVGGRIFVGSQRRRVYSLNALSGCIHWVADADFPVRSAVTIGQQGQKWVAYFGDQHANAYGVDAMTGKIVWKTRVNDHPSAVTTGAATLFEGRLYVPASSSKELAGADPNYSCCRFRCTVTALDAARAEAYAQEGAGVWSSPTIDAVKRALRQFRVWDVWWCSWQRVARIFRRRKVGAQLAHPSALRYPLAGIAGAGSRLEQHGRR